MKFLLASGIVLLLLAAAVAFGAYETLVPFGPSTKIFVEIPAGTSTPHIARLLERHGIIRSHIAFDIMSLAQGGTLKAGEYLFDHPAQLTEIYSRLRNGDVFTIRVVIPEGSNIFDIGQRLQQAGLGTETAFVAAARADTRLIADLDPHAPSLEGYLFPDTYQFSRHATPLEIQEAMVRRFRQEAKALGLTSDFRRVVTLASLVQRETPIPAERPLVASVFVNRLAKDMPLMADPSVIYAAMLAGDYQGVIYASDLKSDSPYNTYTHAGLPPGPICSPGVASLEAAMHPATTDYLYFVAASDNPSGKSRFSATLAEQNRNVAAYREAVRKADSH